MDSGEITEFTLGGCRVLSRALDREGRAAEREAVEALVGCAFPGKTLIHNAEGAPLIEGEHISVSHGASTALLAIGAAAVGIDIERPRVQLEKVAPKFIRPDDIYPSLLHAWTAKEAAFKAWSTRTVTIADIRVEITGAGGRATCSTLPPLSLFFQPRGDSMTALATVCANS